MPSWHVERKVYLSTLQTAETAWCKNYSGLKLTKNYECTFMSHLKYVHGMSTFLCYVMFYMV